MIAAIDCDLRQSYCVSDTGHVARGPDPVAILPPLTSTDTVLFEIASPVSFVRGAAGSAPMYQLAKWAIWNTAQAMRVAAWVRKQDAMFLVAPSDVWTYGHKRDVRHMIAGCKQPKKDLRDCEAMTFFYLKGKHKWLPLRQYLADLARSSTTTKGCSR